MSDSFSLSEELTVGGRLVSYMSDLAYNERMQAIGYHMPALDGHARQSVVHDFNNGIAFTIVHGGGAAAAAATSKCHIAPIEAFSFDARDSGSADYANVRLKTPGSFLLLDSDFVYTGERQVNNVPARIMSAYRSADNGTNEPSLFVEFAFSVSAFVFFSCFLCIIMLLCMSLFLQQNKSDETIRPLSLMRHVNKEPVKHSSFYKFHRTNTPAKIDAARTTLDVSKCFPPEVVIAFRVRVKLDNALVADAHLLYERQLSHDADVFLRSNAQESFTRFTPAQAHVSHDKRSIIIRSAVLPAPPPLGIRTLRLRRKILIFILLKRKFK